MSQIVEVSETGVIQLPPEVLEKVKPHTRFIVEMQNGAVLLQPEKKEQPFWATATPEEWVANFRQWVESVRVEESSPPLPDEALHREDMYD